MQIHGMSGTRPNNIWKHMKNRCSNSKNKHYIEYGARGIKVCERWLKFENFWTDMKNGYANNLTLDRIDNNGNYEPNNCRWVTRKEQSNNTRRNHLITYNSKTMSLSQWARDLGINCHTLKTRINQNSWSIQRAFNQPIRNY